MAHLYVRGARLSLEQRKNHMLEEWHNLLEYTKTINAFNVHFAAMRVAADMFFEFKDFKNAIMTYKNMKTYCEDYKRYKEKILCYSQIGYIFRLLTEHEKAIKYFRKELELAW